MIATGGGAVLDPENVEALRRGASVFLLEGSPEELARRCATGDRPALTALHAPRGDPDRARGASATRTGPRPTTVSGPDAGRPTRWRGQVMAALAARPVGRAPRRARGPEPDPGEAEAVDAALAGGALLCAVAGHPIGHSRSPALFARLCRTVRPPLRLHTDRLRRPRRGPPARGPARPARPLGHAPAQGGDAPALRHPLARRSRHRGREHRGPMRGTGPRQQHGLARGAGAARAPRGQRVPGRGARCGRRGRRGRVRARLPRHGRDRARARCGKGRGARVPVRRGLGSTRRVRPGGDGCRGPRDPGRDDAGHGLAPRRVADSGPG